MKIYDQFHGEINAISIGKELRMIIEKEKTNFKVLTGYGSTSGKCVSKQMMIKVLIKLKKEDKIKGFLPGDIKYNLLDKMSIYYDDKIKYYNIIKNDPDFGNAGIIFVFMK
ncbi:MAG: hypothetical protein ACI32E_04895 [Bacilli bacterium]